METVVDFMSKVSDMVKSSMDETKSSIGKEIVDTTAGKKGVCIDRVTDFFGTKISFLGVKYDKSDIDQLENFSQDVLVCQGSNERFFVPMSDVTAVGDTIVLLKSELRVPEVQSINIKKDDVFKRFHLTKEAIRDIMPDSIPKAKEKKEEDKKWLKKLIGE